MSVLIKDMEMPKNCHECPLLYVTSLCDGLKDCPLVPVPPHGRLIDADVLKEASHYDDYDVCVVDADDIDNAPTIISADESDMDSFIHILKEDDEEDVMDSFIRILKD